MRATDITVEQFRAKVSGHLATALALLPDQVPEDVFDASVCPMMDELQALDEFLFDLGSEERDQESAERRRENKVAAKAHKPEIESLVTRLDYSIQKLVEMVGQPNVAYFVTPMFVDLLVDAFVKFLDAVPAAAFAEDRPVPDSFPSRRDETVAAIVALMAERMRAKAAS